MKIKNVGVHRVKPNAYHYQRLTNVCARTTRKGGIVEEINMLKHKHNLKFTIFFKS